MIKVLIINSTLERSGLTNIIYNISKFIDHSKVEIHILTLSPERENSLLKSFLAIPVQVHSLNLSRVSFLLGIGKILREMVIAINPDIIHTHSFRGSYLTHKYLAKYKHVVSIHGVVEDNYRVVYGSIVGKYLAKKETAAFKNAQMRTVVSMYLASYYNKYGAIQAIPNGVDHSVFFRVSNKVKLGFRQNLQILPDAKVFVFAADLIERKGPIEVINAFVKAEIANGFLIVLGKGPLLNNCIKVANANVSFRGQVQNVDEYYKAADFFISAASSEGFGLSIVEAALCGLKCLVTDLPAHREIFFHNPSQVDYFEVGNSQMLSDLMKSACLFAGPDKLDFSVSEMAQKYLDCYSNLNEN